MQLVAIYIHPNKDGIKEETINFGGNYFYKAVALSYNNIEIERTINRKYIHSFYSKDNSLINVSAIVGKNGSGKTRFLKNIIDSCLSGDNESNILIYENVDSDIKKINSYFQYYESPIRETLVVKSKGELFEIKKFDKKINTIYYSPHLDNIYGFNGIDLSLNTIISNDLKEVEIHEENDFNTKNGILPHHLNNFKRKLEFYKEVSILKEIIEKFKLPTPQKLKVHFSGASIVFDKGKLSIGNKLKNLDNISITVQNYFEDIIAKNENENEILLEPHEPRYSPNSRKLIQKHNALQLFISVILKVMNEINLFWSELDIEPPNENLNALESFFYFLDNHTFSKFKNSKEESFETRFPVKEIKDLLLKVNQLIDENSLADESNSWAKLSLEPSLEDVVSLYDLELKFRNKLKHYFNISNNTELEEIVNSFTNFEWIDRELSSGENLIFNLFSRLWSIKTDIDSSDTNHFILFLDEADAGFHPEWKKKYVDIITSITPYLFNKNDVTFQIIFTTHDPLSLSDILNYNIIYRYKEGDTHKVYSEEEKPHKSFAANISDLLSDSYFIGDGLIGDFAHQKIKETIKWLKSDSQNEHELYKLIIENIDEPIVGNKLAEMYDEKMSTDLQLNLLLVQKEKIEKAIEKRNQTPKSIIK